MAESLITDIALKDYLSSIDTSRIENRKVLAEMQLLHPNIMESLVYYLVNGAIGLSQFYALGLTNRTASDAIDAAASNGSLVGSQVQFYRKKIQGLTGYNAFVLAQNAGLSGRVTRFTVAGDDFIKYVAIDPLRILPDTYGNLAEVFDIYMGIVDDVYATPAYTDFLNAGAAMKALIPQADTTGIITHIDDRVRAYGFINTTKKTLNTTVDKDSILGFALRGMHHDICMRNFIADRERILLEFARYYNADAPKLGVIPLQTILADSAFSWNSALKNNGIIVDATFLNRLSRIAVLRYVFATKYYGAAYLPLATVNENIAQYESVLNFFDKLRIVLQNIVDLCKSEL